MDVCEFQGRIFGKYNSQLFVFEFSWDNVRPIEYVGWNGNKFEIVDKKYKSDLFDQYYGFGSREMKLVCKTLYNDTEFEPRRILTNPADFWRWCGHRTQWWRDRECLFASTCVNPTIESWKHLIRICSSKTKTLKSKGKMRATRRSLKPT